MRFLPSILLLAALSISPSIPSAAQSASAGDSHEARTARAFDATKKQGPLALRDFLIGMPKGADLHVHLSGAVYAESFLRAAGEDGLCIDTKALNFAKTTFRGLPKGLGTASRHRHAGAHAALRQPRPLRQADRCFFDAQLCALRRLERPRPVLLDLRSLRRHRQEAYRRMGR